MNKNYLGWFFFALLVSITANPVYGKDQTHRGEWTKLREWTRENTDFEIYTYVEPDDYYLYGKALRRPEGRGKGDVAYALNGGHTAVDEAKTITVGVRFWKTYYHDKDDVWKAYIDVRGYLRGVLLETGWGHPIDWGIASDSVLPSSTVETLRCDATVSAYRHNFRTEQKYKSSIPYFREEYLPECKPLGHQPCLHCRC